MVGVNNDEAFGSGESSRICVAVRFRPLSEKEKRRGDSEVWRCEGNSVGVFDEMGMDVKFKYDHVFSGLLGNEVVYETVGSKIVQRALDGINGTIFAYGVTSSGKTHTMMGQDQSPGMIPQAIAEIFDLIKKLSKRKEFVLKLTMIEIYNEVVNDLLDPANTNLRLREDSRRGVYVEGLKEERLRSAEHALQVVALGNEQRKIGATAFNEGSSRSHTIIRMSIEANDRPEFASDPDAKIGRTLSYLTMVDLAGSESARAEVNRNQRVEGSFINKSLLTLGTVIHKLSEGGAVHIPFRDSKLTRILSNSLTGNGALIAVVCTITPASTQAEETHNTLKFASRAKKITIEAKRNEIMDHASIIAKYQQENAILRRQLDIYVSKGGQVAKFNEASHPQILSLKEKIEEEHAAVVEGEQERLRLVERVEELTECVLDLNQALNLLGERVKNDGRIPDDHMIMENDKLRAASETLSSELRRLKQGNNSQDNADVEDNEITMQAFYAEREFLNDKLEQMDSWNQSLALALERLKILIASSKSLDPDSIDLDGIIAGDFTSLGTDAPLTAKDNGQSISNSLQLRQDPKIIEKVLKLEEKVARAIDALQRKEEKLARQTEVQKTLNGLNEEVHSHVADLTSENQNLRKELERVEAQNEQLQGYRVDHLSEQELLGLIGNLTSAVDRVRLTVQTKNIGMKTRERSTKFLDLSSPEQRASGGRMTMEYMSQVIEDLKQHRFRNTNE